MRTNSSLAMAVMIAFIFTAPSSHAAGDNIGKIGLPHLNSSITGRGICFQMDPQLPTKWACIYKDNSLYVELTELVFSAWRWSPRPAAPFCRVAWRETDSRGHAVVNLIECAEFADPLRR